MFVRAPNPIWYLPDLIGQPLNDEYYAFFLTNTLPYLPQNVYRDPQGMTVWTGDVVQFFPNGTLPDNLYFDPNLVYRIEIRHGNSQTDPLIYEINNFVPGSGGNSPSNALAILSTDNEATNTTFALVNFTATESSSQPTLTISTAGTYEIAPGWELVLTGAGTTVLTQLILSGDQDQINNPPFALRVNSTGWTTSFLRQRLNHNGAIWANGAITMAITARAQTVPETVSLIYQPNAPGVPQVVATGSLGTGDYQVLQGAIDLPASVNSALSTVAYVDLIIQLPPTGIVDISSFQVIGQSDPLPTNFNPLTDIPTYQQQSEERMIDHTFHLYKDSLLRQQKDNLLAGWTFGQNPWQFITTADTVVASQTQYIADQTILHQETAGAYTSGKGGGGINFGLQLFSVNGVNANRFALIQYLDYTTTLPYWGQILSSMVRSVISTTHNTKTTLKVRLIYRATPPPTISATEPITGWDVNGDLNFAAGWTQIAPLNDISYVLEELVDQNFPAMAYDQFQLPNAPSATPYLGIVVYITTPINNSLGTEDAIAFDRISLLPNDFAIDANAETFDEALRRCQFYYEKSYFYGLLPGTITANAMREARSVLAVTDPAQFHPFSFNASLLTVKRANATMTFYSPRTGSSGVLNAILFRDGLGPPLAGGSGANPQDYALAGNFIVGGSSNNYVVACVATTTNLIEAATPTAGDQAIFQYHYVADARLGV